MWLAPYTKSSLGEENYQLLVTHQNGVPDEENGRVVAHEIVVAVLGVELDGEATWVSHCVC